MKSASYQRLVCALVANQESSIAVAKKVEASKSSSESSIHFIELALAGETLVTEVRNVLLADPVDPPQKIDPDLLRERLLGAIAMYEAMQGPEPANTPEVRAVNALVTMIKTAFQP